jgi:CRISPR-associated protein Cmr6
MTPPHAFTYVDPENGVPALIGRCEGNVDLEWNRYLPLWQEGPQRVPNLYEPLAEFARRASERRGRESWLQEHRQRQRRATESIARYRRFAVVSWEGVLISRMAMGLGAHHPTENGFSFDHATGLPVISGRSVKGLCRAAASLYAWECEVIKRLFGPWTLEGSTDKQGEAIFFDAWPTSWPNLEVDITNNHHPEYYRDSKQNKPVETEDPNPVNFLTVAEGARFMFFLLVPGADKGRMQALLQSALGDLGIGAKTAVGYGRFASWRQR